MANRYFIAGGATANWNDPLRWSSTSGGTGGDVLGSNLVVNGTFDTDTSWVKSDGITISGGTVNFSGGVDKSARQMNPSNTGKWFKVTFTITERTAGSVAVFVDGSGVGSTFRNAVGTYTEYVRQTNVNVSSFFIYTNDGFIGSVDNVIVQEVLTIPTSSDNAIFDANSLSAPCNLTINAEANCLDLDFSGLDNLLTLTNAAYNLNVYGNLTLTSNTYLATAFTGTGYLQLRATTSVNITSNGCTRGWNYFKINGIGGTFNFVDNWFSTAIFNPQNGTINLGSYSHLFGQIRYNTGVAVLNAQSSTITTQQFWNDGGTSFTFNAGTSTFRITLVNATPFTFYNLEYDPSNSRIEVWGNQTVLNNFICNGTNGTTGRLLVQSPQLGVSRTITVNGSIVASNVDFRDITLAGTANRDLSAITGGSGDCGGNSGITFTPAANQYFKHSGTSTVNWSDTTKWFTTSGGVVQGRVPLPQDDAIFDANSFDANCILNVNVPRIGGLNMEGVDQAVIYKPLNHLEIYKNYIFGNNVTYQGSVYNSIYGRASTIVKPYIAVFWYFNVSAVSDVILEGYLNCSGLLTVLGKFDTAGFNITCYNFSSSSSTQLVRLRDSEITLTNSFDPGSSTETNDCSVTALHTSGTASCSVTVKASKRLRRLTIGNGNLAIVRKIDTGAIDELILNKNSTIRFTITTHPISKIVSNGTPSEKINVTSDITASQANINYTGTGTPFIENVILKDINFTVPVYALNGTNLGNNTNVKYVWKVAKKTMGFPIRLVKDE